MKTPYLEIFLSVVVIGASLIIYFFLKWFFESKRWFKTKTFIVRFIISPIILLFGLLLNPKHPDVQSIFWFIILLAALDRFAAWADRKVPDSNPRKYR